MIEIDENFEKSWQAYEMEARVAAKKIAEAAQEAMIMAMKESSEEARNGLFFQAMTCDIASSFMFGTTIRILKDRKVDPVFMKAICQAHIQQAFFYCDKTNFKKHREH